MTDAAIIDKLSLKFQQAMSAQDIDAVSEILTEFDQYSRQVVEKEENLADRAQQITELLAIHDNWQLQLLQLKAKVKDKLADIKSNGKKINKYLTSY